MHRKTLLIMTFGGGQLGIGHLMRDIELAKILQKDINVFFHLQGNIKALDIFKKYNLDCVIYSEDLNNAIDSCNPDLVLYDRPYSLGKIEQNGRLKNIPIIGLDYFFYDDSRIRSIINIKSHYLIDNKEIKIDKIYEGTEFAIIRHEIYEKNYKSETGEKVKNILITFGGEDPKNNTEKVIELLDSIVSNKFNVTIVKGYFFKHDIELSEISPHNYDIINSTMNIGELMDWSDLIFCGAGTTIMEACYIGRPAIILTQSDDESAFASDIAGNDAAYLVNNFENLDSENNEIVKIINDYAKRKNLVKNGRILFDGKGKIRIKKIVLQELGIEK